jgi:copper chaperone
MESLRFEIEGMSCGYCVARVEKTLSRLNGVQVQKVDVGSAEVLYDPEFTPFRIIAEALEDAGYQAQPPRQEERLS